MTLTKQPLDFSEHIERVIITFCCPQYSLQYSINPFPTSAKRLQLRYTSIVVIHLVIVDCIFICFHFLWNLDAVGVLEAFHLRRCCNPLNYLNSNHCKIYSTLQFILARRWHHNRHFFKLLHNKQIRLLQKKNPIPLQQQYTSTLYFVCDSLILKDTSKQLIANTYYFLITPLSTALSLLIHLMPPSPHY